MTIGEAMITARKKAGLKQKELAKISGISVTNISSYENDKIIPNLATVIVLADTLGISIDEYIGHEAKNKKDVIVPPCKVGDIVHIPSKIADKVFSRKVLEILCKEDDSFLYVAHCYFSFKNIGKTVFLTYEEAEEALQSYKKDTNTKKEV